MAKIIKELQRIVVERFQNSPRRRIFIAHINEKLEGKLVLMVKSHEKP